MAGPPRPYPEWSQVPGNTFSRRRHRQTAPPRNASVDEWRAPGYATGVYVQCWPREETAPMLSQTGDDYLRAQVRQARRRAALAVAIGAAIVVLARRG